MTKEEILSQYYGNVYEEPEEFIEIVKAMEQYRNEGLREELRNFADWITKPGFIHVYYYEVDEYLKQKP